METHCIPLAYPGYSKAGQRVDLAGGVGGALPLT
jgi:hypothetical protein